MAPLKCYLWLGGKVGMANRALSYVSVVWFAMVAKCSELHIFEELNPWCPDSIKSVCIVPAELPSLGISKVRITTETGPSAGPARVQFARRAKQDGALWFSCFYVPRHVQHYVKSFAGDKIQLDALNSYPPLITLEQRLIKLQPTVINAVSEYIKKLKRKISKGTGDVCLLYTSDAADE